MEEQNAIVVAEKAQPIMLGDVRVNGPTGLIPVATQVATELVKIVDRQKLFKQIGPKKYPLVEAWTTCAAMLGVTPRESGVVEHDGEFEATVELVNGRGEVIGRASAICGMDEPTWASRPRYARRSMAITRATGKACRLKYSWIMTLAGYEPTPAEEMDGVIDITPPATRQPAPKPHVSAPAEHEPLSEEPPTEAGGAAANAGLKVEQMTPEEIGAIVVHWGKNKGTTLAELEPRSVVWYANDWNVKPWKGEYKEVDLLLQAACRRLCELNNWS
jgi:hypothetical protein